MKSFIQQRAECAPDEVHSSGPSGYYDKCVIDGRKCCNNTCPKEVEAMPLEDALYSMLNQEPTDEEFKDFTESFNEKDFKAEWEK